MAGTSACVCTRPSQLIATLELLAAPTTRLGSHERPGAAWEPADIFLCVTQLCRNLRGHTSAAVPGLLRHWVGRSMVCIPSGSSALTAWPRGRLPLRLLGAHWLLCCIAGCPQWTASQAHAARIGALTIMPAARSRCAASLCCTTCCCRALLSADSRRATSCRALWSVSLSSMALAQRLEGW